MRRARHHRSAGSVKSRESYSSCGSCSGYSSDVEEEHTIKTEPPAAHVGHSKQTLDLRNIKRDVCENRAFRRVLHTYPTMQLVAMHVEPETGGIPRESHPTAVQMITVVRGKGLLRMWTSKYHRDIFSDYPLSRDTLIMIPSGTEHEIQVIGSSPLKLYTVYSPPQHKPGTFQVTRPEDD